MSKKHFNLNFVKTLLLNKKIIGVERTSNSNGFAIHLEDGTCLSLWFTNGELYVNEVAVDLT